MLRIISAASLLVGLIATPSAAQTQGPDILIPSGSSDGAYALVDKNKDGKYTTAGEAWDYILSNFNTSPRNHVIIGKKIHIIDTIQDQLVWVQDANTNGLIEASERHVFYDAGVALGACEPNRMALDGAGWIWWANDYGTKEGVYKSKDLNNDGDAEDTGETVAVLVEPTARPNIMNTPKSSATTQKTLFLGNIDSIMYDPTWGKGRFIIEDENYDQSLALEDKNQDGDFTDAGEVYLFAALYNGGSLAPDIHPDVAGGTLPSANEIRTHAVNTLTKEYFLMSTDTGSANSDAGIIFRGVDKNNDGDVNDAGEINIFWDGSLDSTGATKGYNFCYGMTVDLALGLFVTAEWNGDPDHERLLLLKDGNNDGDANDAGEGTVLWDLPVDRTHYVPTVLPAGTLSTLTGVSTPAVIAYYGSATCASSLSATSFHNIQKGINGATRQPVIGNSIWTIRTWGANPSSPGIYGIGVTKFDPGFPMGVGGTCHVYNSLDFLVFSFATNTAGVSDTVVPIPNNKSLIGLWSYWQSAVTDANAPNKLGFTLSDAFEAKMGDYAYTH